LKNGLKEGIMAVFTKIGAKLDQGVDAGKKAKVVSRSRGLIARLARGVADLVEPDQEKDETAESKD